MQRFARLLLALIVARDRGRHGRGAQDFRGGIRGTVTDATGGVLPGVTRHRHQHRDRRSRRPSSPTRRGCSKSSTSTRAPIRSPRSSPGFQTSVRTDQQVRVGDVARLDVTLATGGMQESVQVNADAPLLNTTTGISGTTIDSKQIAELPLGDGTAYMLTRLAPGIVDSSDLHFARPADNGNLAGIVANGAQGGNEFTIDGAPNMSNARGVGFSPPSDAISQFKVQTNAFDAQTGHTAGAVVNLALKSGTNALPRGRGLLQPRRQPVGHAAADRAGGRHQADARVQPLHRHAERPDREEQDVLHGVVRAPARRAAGAGDLHRADREDARRRLQRVHRRRSSIR